jgi:Tfp pilus assembly protein FimV
MSAHSDAKAGIVPRPAACGFTAAPRSLRPADDNAMARVDPAKKLMHHPGRN